MRVIYSWLIRIAAPLAFAVVLWRAVRDPGYRPGLTQRFGFGPALPSCPSIWVHAVSLGEMTAAAPLVRELRARYPQHPLVLTTATPAGRARALALFAGAADVRFLPYDTPGSVRRFLTRIRPCVAIIMETELWPNVFRECERRRVPVFLASARLSVRSVQRYRRLRKLFSGVFTPNVSVAAQSTDDAGRFKSIGAPANQIHVVGNLKFDLRLGESVVAAGRLLRSSYGGARPVWAAGSTHAGEEEQLLDAHLKLRAHFPNALLLLAPRHQDRFASVADLLARDGVNFLRRSRMAPGAVPSGSLVDTAVILVDTLGELATLYASCDVVFVGGSLVPVGGHNLLEPAALGLPVLTGPSYFNGEDIAQLLLREGAASQVRGVQELVTILRRLLDNPAERARIGAIGKHIVNSNRGSVDRLIALIAPAVSAERPSGASGVVRPSAGH